MAIAAVSDNWVIGKDGKLPWHFPEDLRAFRSMTVGRAVIMGYNTYRSLPHPLDMRMTLVVSSRCVPELFDFSTFGVRSIKEAVEVSKALELDAVFAGGAGIYEEGLDYCSSVSLTRVKGEYEGDTFFPFEKLERDFEPFSYSWVTDFKDPNLSFEIWVRKE